MVRGGRIDEARWLLAVDSLLKMSVKKRVLHVQLANRSRAGSSDAQDSRIVGGLTIGLNVSS